ncbi:hypothetical protein Micbo1qcDRAFT_229809 [Microdochium bolleyi]|uniref:Uncharacterized protein n=1 Tax=Microdochium bolleyi TaxID=196109 RepID=A0A136JIS2_9PEZI|nr:hypothetical protein Micbo1qcDRAFT_229809 [Microdochium bolleyi]
MKLLYVTSVLAGLAAAAPPPLQSRQQPASTACGRIASSKQQRVPTSLALECLRSVPIKKEPAKKLVTSLRSYASWQSTLAWLKDPPKTYLFAAVDILGRLDEIATAVDKDGYTNEYDFQLDLYKLVLSAHDGHFTFAGDIFRPFNFQNDLAARIISVSRDGVEPPRLYPYAAASASTIADQAFITEINGVNATDFILRQNADFSSYQDPDAQWNSMFPTLTKPHSYLTVASSLVYQGDNVTLTYSNGTKQTEQSYAALYADLSNIKNGEDFYNKFCSGTSSASSMRIAQPAEEGLAKRQTPGFPTTVVADAGGTISGYFLSGKGYDDAAVLAVKAFSSSGTQPVKYLNDFQNTTATFLEKCRAAGKKRLIIDLSANGGGYVVAGYELFAQIFPELKQFGATNIRRSESFVTIAKIVGDLSPSFQPKSLEQQNSVVTLSQSTILTNLVPGGVQKPDGEQFATVDDILAPVTLRGDQFTAYQNTPLAQTLPGFNLTGSPGHPKPPPAVFSSENVLLLTDGTCGSTCTIFSYLMTIQGNVKSTAIGGRPRTGPMQSVGGVEGSQIFPLAEIKKTANAAIGLVDSARQTELRAGDLGVLAEGYAISRSTDPKNPGGVNGKNSFLPGDSSTPAQFLWQPANCRFFYTAPMLGDAKQVWQRAVDSAWTDPDRFCVAGSRVSVNTTASMVDGGFGEEGQNLLTNLEPAAGATGKQEGAAAGRTVGRGSWTALLVGVMTALLSQC